MNSELNIIKIAKSIRNLKVLVKSSLMNKDIRLQIEHAKNSVIDLDNSLSILTLTEELDTSCTSLFLINFLLVVFSSNIFFTFFLKLLFYSSV